MKHLTWIPPGGILFVSNRNTCAIMKTSKEKLMRRLKIIEGQIRGLQEMIEKGSYCIDVITQTSAVKQALSNVEDILLEGHLGGCVVKQMHAGQVEKVKKEVLAVYKLKRK